MVSAAQVANNV